MASRPAGSHAPGLTTFLLWHTSLREDAIRLVDVLRGDRDVDAAALSAWFTAYAHALHLHLVAEDDVLWPAADKLDSATAAIAASGPSGHDEVEAAACRVAVALDAYAEDTTARPAALTAAEGLADVLGAHLDHEEDVVLPLAAVALGPARWAVLEEAARADAGPQVSAFVLPWLLAHADAAQRAAVLAVLPSSASAVLAERLQPSYERMASVLDAAGS